MTVCQDPWSNGPSREATIDVEALRRERIGQYLVPLSDETDAQVHIVDAVEWGEESAGGTVNLELWTCCRAELVTGHVLARELPSGRLVCQECRRKHGHFLVEQANS